MKRFIFAFLLLSGSAQAQVPMVVHDVKRTDRESDTVVTLLGRACRAANDQEWIQVCAAAVAQAMKELEARKLQHSTDEKPKP